MSSEIDNSPRNLRAALRDIQESIEHAARLVDQGRLPHTEQLKMKQLAEDTLLIGNLEGRPPLPPKSLAKLHSVARSFLKQLHALDGPPDKGQTRQ